MRMTDEARQWLDATVRRIMARHHLSEPERAGVHYELMSHLHSAGERKAAEIGREEVTVTDLQAALSDAGGDDALAQAFVIPLARPLRRATPGKRFGAFVIDFILVGLAWWILAGMLFVVFAPLAWLTGSPLHMMDFGDVFDGPPGMMRGGFLAFGYGFLSFVALVGLALAYYAWFEGNDGQTVGKRVMGLKAVRTDGSAIGRREAVIRNLVKAFPWFTFPLLVVDAIFLLFVFKEDQQRASDRVADTIVVEV